MTISSDVSSTEIRLSQDDLNMIALAGCTLEKVPGNQNWVDSGGGLPDYICRIAKALVRSGKSVSSAIAIAVSRCKVWASGGGDVDADTRGKAAAAIAQWEKLKSKSGKKTKLSNQEENILNLTAFNLSDVSKAYQDHTSSKRREWNKTHRTSEYYSDYVNPYPYRYVKEVWSNYLIVQDESSSSSLSKVSFKANKDGSFVFEDEIPVKQNYVVIKDTTELSLDISDAELVKLSVVPCNQKERGSLSDMVALSARYEGKTLAEKFEDMGLKL